MTRHPFALGFHHFKSLFLALAALLIAALLTPAELSARVLRVPDEHPTIQAAIDAAVSGDDIVLTRGITFTEHNITFRGKAIRVRGEDPRDPDVTADTLVDGGGRGSVFVFASGEDRFSVLAGLTVTGGKAEDGGGIHIRGAAPTLEHLVVEDNEATRGGGLACHDGQPTLHDIVVRNNRALGQGTSDSTGVGGGVYSKRCDSAISGSVDAGDASLFAGNEATAEGGGIFMDGGIVRITDATLADNRGLQGGGLFCGEGATCQLKRVTVSGNQTRRAGGGIAFVSNATSVLLTSSIVRDNRADTGLGGGVFGTLGQLGAQNSVFLGNQTPFQGGALALENGAGARLLACTLADNRAGEDGAAIFATDSAPIEVVASILWNEGDAGEIADLQDKVEARLSNIRGGFGEGNFDVDPLFDETGFRLTEPSPVRDKANLELLADFDGQQRPCSVPRKCPKSRPLDDLGADEFQRSTVHVVRPGQAIKSAVNRAEPGDVIELEPGTYREALIDFRGKALTVRSQDPDDPAIIDSLNRFPAFSLELGTLSHLTIRRGLSRPGTDGGGVFCDEPPIAGDLDPRLAPRIEDSLIENSRARTNSRNEGGRGGGIACRTGTIRRTTVRFNRADVGGGGVAFGVIDENSLIQTNRAPVGAGVFHSEVIDSRILGNGDANTDRGGGLFSPFTSIRRTTIAENRARQGGGIFILQPILIEDSLIEGNTAVQGGGIFAARSSVLLRNTIDRNIAASDSPDTDAATRSDGGGVFFENFQADRHRLLGGTISNNQAERGGGVWTEDRTEISGVDLGFNRAVEGGGLFIARPSIQVTVNRALIHDNSVAPGGHGGGVSAAGGLIQRSVLRANDGGSAGGGLHCDTGDPIVVNSVIHDNAAISGGGLAADNRCAATFRHVTVAYNQARNEGGGLRCTSNRAEILFVDSIFADNRLSIDRSDDLEEIVARRGCGDRIRSSLVLGGFADGEDIFDFDPRFVDPDDGDFHLQDLSPAIDRASGIDAPNNDFDDEPRPFPEGGAFDLGADEVRAEVQPVIIRVDPDLLSNVGGELVRVIGDGFGGFSQVIFEIDNKQFPAAEVEPIDAQNLEVTTPAVDGLEGNARLVVDNGAGGTAAIAVTFATPQPLSLEPVDPPASQRVEGGEEVTVIGTGFTDPTRIFFGGEESLDVDFISTEELEVTTPPAPGLRFGTVDVRAERGGEVADLADGFTYLPPTPRVEAADPDFGVVTGGEQILLSGTSFAASGDALTVLFGAVAAPRVQVLSDTELQVTSPAALAAGPVDLTVRDVFGQESFLREAFEYRLPEAPRIDALDPSSGSVNGGTAVEIQGDFPALEGLGVTVDGIELDEERVLELARNLIVIRTPPALAVGDVEIEVSDVFGQTAAATFTYLAAAPPRIDEVRLPVDGLTTAGGEVTVLGAGFDAGIRVELVEIDGETLTIDDIEVIAEGELRFEAPAFISGVGCTDILLNLVLTNPNNDSDSADLLYEVAQTLRVPAEVPTLQQAIQAARAGACILAAPTPNPDDFYRENLVIEGKPLSIYGDPDEKEATRIQAADAELPVIQIEGNFDAGTLLSGLMIVLGNGGIVMEASSPRLEDLLIQNNDRREGSGGGVAALRGSAPRLLRTEITTNTALAGSGGGVFADDSSRIVFRGGNLIQDNIAGEDGGGVLLPAESETVLQNEQITENTAGGSGGGVAIGAGATLEMISTTLFRNNAATDGGGLFVANSLRDAPARVEIRDSVIEENEAPAGSGGGLHLGIGADVEISGGSVSRNQAALAGAGIFLGNDSVSIIEGVDVVGNTGVEDNALDGGGIFVGEKAGARIEDNTLRENLAQQGGGIFLSRKSEVTVACNTVRDNRVASLSGEPDDPVLGPGILSNDNSSPFCRNTIEDNLANGETDITGGLHFLGRFGTPDVALNTFARNTPDELACVPSSFPLRNLDSNIFDDPPEQEIVGCVNSGARETPRRQLSCDAIVCPE